MRRTLLDDAGETHLEEFGFAVVDFLTPELIAELERLHAQVGDAPDDPRRALYFGFHSESLAYKREMHHQILEVLREPAGVLFDRHEIYLATFIVKWPGPDSGFGPHQDPTLVDERFYRGVTLWAPLLPTGRDDRGNDNGMLHVVAGSHRFRQYARVRDVNQSIYADLEDEILGGCGAGVPTALGEAIVFDDQLIHYSVANATDEPRVVVSIGLRPRESRCVLVRPTRSAGLDLFEVPDASFIEVTSSAQDLWRPEDAPIAHLAPAPPTMSPAEFTRLCSAVRRSPRTVTPTPVRSDGGGRTVDPDAFCAFCGTNLGTLHRGARGKAQMECERCASERAASVRFQLPEEGFCLGTPIASAALAEIEQLFEPFAESANQPFWSSNVHATRADAVHINESLCRIVGSQLASHLRGYQPFLGAFITKAAGEHLVDLHQDWTYTDERSDRCVLAWIPLGDVDASLGALHAIPRSHRWTDGIRPGDVELPAPTDPLQGLLEPLAHTIDARAGQPVLYDPALLHGSGPNHGNRLRVVAAVAFAPTGAQLVHFQRVQDRDGPQSLQGFRISASYFTAQEFRSRPHGPADIEPWTGAVAPTDFADALTHDTLHPVAAQASADPESADPVLTARGGRARLGADGFFVGTEPLLETTLLQEWRNWYLHRATDRSTPEGFEADLNIDDPDYRRAVRSLLEPQVRTRVETMFCGYTPFLYSFLCKWPGDSDGLYLHQDWMYIDEREGGSTFVVWIPLQDVTGHNGQLRVLRGSHRWGRELRGTDLTADWVDDVDTISPALSDLRVPAGVPVILNNRVAHCSYPNYTAEPRVVLAVGMRPIDRPLTYFRRFGPDHAARYEVDDEFFCTHTTGGLHLRPPELPIAEIIRDQRPGIGPAELQTLIRTAGSPGSQRPYARSVLALRNAVSRRRARA